MDELHYAHSPADGGRGIPADGGTQMHHPLAAKIMFVTGATSGLGQVTALRLA